MPDNNAPISPKGASHQSDVQPVNPPRSKKRDDTEYEVEKVVAKIEDRYDRNNDLFEVVWKGYPGQNTWQTRAQLKKAKYTVACFEHPEKVSQLTKRQVKFYGAGKKQRATKVIKNFIF